MDTKRKQPAGFRLMVKLIAEDLESHQNDWTRPGFQALAVHRFGNWRMTITRRSLRKPLSFAYRALFAAIRNVYGIELPYNARIGRNVVIEHQGNIVLHGNAEIGDGCIIRQGVTIGNRHLDRPRAAPKVGCNVNIGAGAQLLGDVVVGDGAKIGANSVVIRDVRPGATVVGIPANEIHERSSLVSQLKTRKPGSMM